MGHELRQEWTECVIGWGAGGELAGPKSGGEHPEIVPLGHPLSEYLVSIYDVTTTMLVTAEAKENETAAVRPATLPLSAPVMLLAELSHGHPPKAFTLKIGE